MTQLGEASVLFYKLQAAEAENQQLRNELLRLREVVSEQDVELIDAALAPKPQEVHK